MSGPGHLVVVGDALLDRDVVGQVVRLAPDAPVPVVDVSARATRPGGAALAALLAARDGRPVTLVTALAGDDAGRELAGLLDEAGIEVVDLGLQGPTPEKVRVRAGDHALVRIDSGGAPSPVGELPDAGRRLLADAAAVLVADYGRGLAGAASVREALTARSPRRPLVWDPHPRGACPVPAARLVTPNSSEAGVDAAASLAEVTARARELAERWQAFGVVVTLGSRGALLVEGDGPPLAAPAPAAAAGDPCGAGDRFASAAAGALADGALPSEAVTTAVAEAAGFVAAGGAAAVFGPRPAGRRPTVDLRPGSGDGDAFALAERVRRAGGTVVATGGCFDLVHAGHVSVLEAARALGDCLIVCLNSDASVRRLKGEGRPLQPQDDRARVLRALRCVDGLVVFDEDTPEAVLRRLRPDVWAKGADYSLASLPEAPLLASWGGQAVVLPYLEGRSTTRLVEEASHRGS